MTMRHKRKSIADQLISALVGELDGDKL